MNNKTNQDTMRKSIKFSQDINGKFDSTVMPQSNLASPTVFKDSSVFDTYSADENLIEEDQKPELHITPKRRFSWLKLGFAVAGITIVVQFVHFIYVSWNDNPAIALGWSIAVGCFLVASLKVLFVELKCLRHLKQDKELNQSLLNSSVTREWALTACDEIGLRINPCHRAKLTKWRAALTPELTGQEIVSLFDKMVLREADAKALTLITQHAAAAGALVSFSPLALVDALVVFWRQLRMLYQLVEHYGYGGGYWVRIKLIRMIFKQSLVAGASEIVSELGSYALGANVMAAVSTRAAQGLGVGVMTARLGLKMMQVCRPVPFKPDSHPRLEDISVSVIEQLRVLTKGKDKAS